MSRRDTLALLSVVMIFVATTLVATLLVDGFTLAATIGALVTAAAVGLGAMFWFIPIREVGHLPTEDAELEKRARLVELRLDSRTSIAQAIGGVLLVLTLAMTAYQANAARQAAEESSTIAIEGQVTERFARAVDQLGAASDRDEAKIDVRVGALFALLRTGEDSERDTQPILHTVASYIRENVKNKLRRSSEPPCVAERKVARRNLRPDVAVALRYVLPELAAARSKRGLSDSPSPGLQYTNFRGTNIGPLKLVGLDITGSVFRDANIGQSEFVGVDATEVDFQDACLWAVNFDQPDNEFTNIDLRGADLHDANVPAGFFDSASHRDCSYQGPITIGGGKPLPEFRPPPPCTLKFRLIGPAKPTPASIHVGRCPEVSSAGPIASATGAVVGKAYFCVLTAKSMLKSGSRHFIWTMRESYELSEGTLETKQTREWSVSRDRRRSRATITGDVEGGTGRYENATGRMFGGGHPSDYRLSIELGA